MRCSAHSLCQSAQASKCVAHIQTQTLLNCRRHEASHLSLCTRPIAERRRSKTGTLRTETSSTPHKNPNSKSPARREACQRAWRSQRRGQPGQEGAESVRKRNLNLDRTRAIRNRTRRPRNQQTKKPAAPHRQYKLNKRGRRGARNGYRIANVAPLKMAGNSLLTRHMARQPSESSGRCLTRRVKTLVATVTEGSRPAGLPSNCQ